MRIQTLLSLAATWLLLACGPGRPESEGVAEGIEDTTAAPSVDVTDTAPADTT